MVRAELTGVNSPLTPDREAQRLIDSLIPRGQQRPYWNAAQQMKLGATLKESIRKARETAPVAETSGSFYGRLGMLGVEIMRAEAEASK